MLFKIALFSHLIGASIWVGGHLTLLIRYVPLAIKTKNADIIRNYENRYGALGIPALITQVITGVYIAFFQYGLKFMNFSNGLERVVNVKLILLLCILGFALHAKFRVIPNLDNKINSMSWHIFFVNLISVTMLFIGMMFRFGGI